MPMRCGALKRLATHSPLCTNLIEIHSATTIMASSLPMWAQSLCQDIECNDPSVTKVTTEGMETHVAIALAQALAGTSTVTELDLDLSFVHANGVGALAEVLATNTSMKTVRIETCFNDSIILHAYPESYREEQGYSRASIARGLAKNATVTKLVLDGAGLDDDFWFVLSEWERNGGKLEELYISSATLAPAFQHFLSATVSLKRLHISNSIVYTGEDNTNFVDSGILCYALQAADEKKTVRLSSVGVQHGVKQYESQRHVILPRFVNIARFRNDVLYIERGFTSDCAVALAAKLMTNTTLKRLYLAENPLGGRGVAALATMLETNTTIQMLDIRSVFIDNEKMAAGALGKALTVNKTLVELRLSNNGGVEFSYPLANALRVNSSLKTLNLSSTNVNDSGATALASTLESNCTLRVLNLNGCHVGRLGAIALAQMLLQNGELKELYLSGNPICETGVQALLNALKKNYRLQSLTFDAYSEANQKELDYWTALTPRGRAMLTRNITPALIPRVLYRVSKDGGANSLFTMLCERPDLV